MFSQLENVRQKKVGEKKREEEEEKVVCVEWTVNLAKRVNDI